MCGINGIFAYHYAANNVSEWELKATRDHMAARGPDDAATWLSEEHRVGLGHRRLSVIDLSTAGRQPFVSSCGNYIITFNGEIYNYAELRRDLRAQGIKFRSETDTEVVLNLFRVLGKTSVEKLNGMFALAIYCKQENSLFLARDPLGVKPLFYSDDGWSFRFASQVKALIAGNGVSAQYCNAGWAGFFTWGNVPEPYTIYDSIKCLPAGSWLEVNSLGSASPRQYYSVARAYKKGEAESRLAPTPTEAAERVRRAVVASVRKHLVSDVPVGIFLSGGVDSIALLSAMRSCHNKEIVGVTVGFEKYKDTAEDELETASAAARLYGINHHVAMVTEDAFGRMVQKFLDAMDQPSVDGANTYLAAITAKECGIKVALSGLGGDELFRSYPSFTEVERVHRYASLPARMPMLGRLVRNLSAPVLELLQVSPKAASVFEYADSLGGAYFLKRALFMPWEVAKIMGRERAAEGLRKLNTVRRLADGIDHGIENVDSAISVLELSIYMRNQLLRDADWASMAHGVELRVPLVDTEVLEEIAAIRGRSGPMSKALLADMIDGDLRSRLLSRGKVGFNTPVLEWMRPRDAEGRGGVQSRGATARRFALDISRQTGFA